MQPQRKNLVLVGFMGTGKSSIGRKVASTLGLSFLDMDARIEEREGRTIPRIFTEDGEPRFRQLERRLVEELAAQTGLVIATGGGVVLDPANLRDFSRSGLVICLQATPETILRRVGHESHRPLLSGGDKLQKIRDLLSRRQALYDAILLRITTDGLSTSTVADRVVQLYLDSEAEETAPPDQRGDA
jgi:shikimate kinase